MLLSLTRMEATLHLLLWMRVPKCSLDLLCIVTCN